MFRITHPELVARTCGDCERWIFREDGSLVRMMSGKPVPRPPKSRPPCSMCPKCLDRIKTPTEGRKSELSNKNQITLQRYYEHIVAPGKVDDIMRRNFGLIRQTLDDTDRMLTKTIAIHGRAM